jgi:hypothetical protein
MMGSPEEGAPDATPRRRRWVLWFVGLLLLCAIASEPTNCLRFQWDEWRLESAVRDLPKGATVEDIRSFAARYGLVPPEFEDSPLDNLAYDPPPTATKLLIARYPGHAPSLGREYMRVKFWLDRDKRLVQAIVESYVLE